jgi:hypothetical protein
MGVCLDTPLGVITIGDLALDTLEQHDQFPRLVISFRLDALFLEILWCVADSVCHGFAGENDPPRKA